MANPEHSPVFVPLADRYDPGCSPEEAACDLHAKLATRRTVRWQSGAPMIVPRRWDDWTVYIPIPSHPSHSPAYFTVSDTGLRGGASSGPFTHGVFIRLAVWDTTGPELRGIDWVNDWGSSTYGMRQSRTSHASYADYQGRTLVLGLVTDRDVTTHPRLEIVGEPHVGGSFYVMASQFKSTASQGFPGPVSVSMSQTLGPPTTGCTSFLGGVIASHASLSVDGAVPHGAEYVLPFDRSLLIQRIYFQAQQIQTNGIRYSNLATVRIGGRF